jgi:hypothetical protein
MKHAEIEIFPNIYKTDELNGSNLIWVGKNYFFKKVNTKKELHFSIKQN